MSGGIIFDIYAISFALVLAALAFGIAWLWEHAKERRQAVNDDWQRFQDAWRG